MSKTFKYSSEPAGFKLARGRWGQVGLQGVTPGSSIFVVILLPAYGLAE